MKLIITQPEIESIVRAHVLNTVQLREGADIKIDFVATRGDDGITATIDIPYMGVAGIPAISREVDAQAAATDIAAPTTPVKPATQAKPSPVRKTAGSILGAGTKAATELPPIATPVVAAAAPEAAAPQADAAGPETAQDDAAPTPPAADAAQEAAAPAAADGAEAPTRGPSLFSKS